MTGTDRTPAGGVRRAALTGATAALLAGPTALAFFAGGYFDAPREWAGLIAWLIAAVALLAGPSPLARGRGGALALGGLVLLAAWTLLSLTWAPVAGNAYHAGQRVFLYAGVLVAAAALLRAPASRRVVEPALAAGTLIVIGYALSERLLPGVLQFARSVSAQGRLEQPLTYWNATGELAAIGLVLCARIAGDRGRSRALRLAASAAAAPLGMGLYLSFSRGALFACAAGLVALAVLAPERAQLRGLAVCIGSGALAAAAAAPFGGMTSLSGSLATREGQGALTLALLGLIVVVTVFVQRRLMRDEPQGRVALPRRAGWLALGLIVAGLAVAIAIGAKESSSVPLSAGATRLTTLQSNRYSYWSVALRAFADEPLHGIGAENWSVYWLRYRTVREYAQDAHSLPLQTLAELGIVGLALLLVFIGAVALAARDALRRSPAAAAGATAGLVAYIAHAPLDWDWQMPALTLVAVVLAGALVALAER